MEREAKLQTDIARVLELIRVTNTMIDQLYQAGKEETSLALRQEKRLRQQYTDELNELFKHYHLAVSTLAS